MAEQRETRPADHQTGQELAADQGTSSLSLEVYGETAPQDHTPPPPSAEPFQVMPPLSDEEYEALVSDIQNRGVLVPVLVDQDGRIIDGHHRRRACDELGVDCPTEVRHVGSDEEARQVALTLNCARRHITREQQRQVIVSEITRCPDDSDRAIARRVGCSPTTVGTVRRRVSNLDTTADTTPITAMSTAEAEERTENIRALLARVRESVAVLVWLALSNKISAAEVVLALTTAQREHERRSHPEVAEVFRVAVFTPLIDAAMSEENATFFRPHWDHETFEPMTEDERAELLGGIASLGGGQW